MGFFRERVVKRPQMEHKCDFCRKLITGAHTYVSGKGHYDFFVYRAHHRCYEDAKIMCLGCSSYEDCDSDITECYSEMLMRREHKEKLRSEKEK